MADSTFAELGVSAEVVAALEDGGITDAFPIQAATIQATLQGRDICGKAPTGSGKTLAFGVPVVELAGKGKSWRPRALILAPTRELATQIKEELEPLAKARQRTIVTVFGGTNIERDIRRLEKSVDILVACPGRLEDLIARRCCELRDVDIVVIDEADRMADMGFLPSVKRLVDQTSQDRHTLLFSATLDGDVNTLITRYQNEPLRFEVEEQIGEIGDVEHSWYLIQPTDRIGSAVAVLRGYESSIVFCRTRRGCDRVAQMLAKRGLAAVAIHGDRSQGQRERALQDFVSGKAQVLVATDVAARGIHVDNVALVMHYDPAGSDKDYIHRSGRTGRAGQDGRVISMVVDDKKKIARQLQKDLGLKPGLETLDLEALPPAVDRPKPKPVEAKQTKRDGDSSKPSRNRGDKSKNRDSRGGRNRDDRDSKNRDSRGGRTRDDRDSKNRDSRGGRTRDDRDSKNRDSRGGRTRDDRDSRGGRNRDDRESKNRDSRGGRTRDGERTDRSGNNPRGKRRPPRRRGSNDWYPPGYYDDKEGDRDNRDGRGRGKDGGRGRGPKSQGRGGTKAGGSKSRGSKSKGNKRPDRRNSDGKDRDDDAQPGGSGTTKRKNRAAKGRHSDKGGSKNKGKRRSRSERK